MAGKAVGLVLSGGGSRGLAHLGILKALDDIGIPVDVVGGTSQGAFIAALFAQNLPIELMARLVRQYADKLGNIKEILFDLTLPILSVFSGYHFDRVLRDVFSHGPQNIEDLWTPFFCLTTNLTKGEAQSHHQGPISKLVRASMTIVGMLPPICYNGDLLVDGGYINNIPVDIVRSMGVDTVIVVDVESKDSMWQNLTPYEGGISGWQILWDKWCPVPSLRFGAQMPKYSQLIN